MEKIPLLIFVKINLSNVQLCVLRISFETLKNKVSPVCFFPFVEDDDAVTVSLGGRCKSRWWVGGGGAG